MKWTKPPLKEPMRDYYIDGEGGWRICKGGNPPVYLLSRRGVLVQASRDLAELKRRADENLDAD